MGTGNGHFAAPVQLPVDLGPLTMPSALGVGDFNHDGILDAAVYDAAGGTVTVFDGSTVGLVPAVRVAANNPGGARLVTGDFNGDGSVDLATISEDSSVNVLFNRGDGALLPAVHVATNLVHTGAVAVGDFNGDGATDIALVTFDSMVHTFLSAGGPAAFRLVPAGVNTCNGPVSSIVSADLDADGKADLVVGGPGMIGYELGNGDGTFATPMMLKTSTGPVTPNGLAVGDFNGDGTPDIAATNTSASTIDFYFSHVSAISGAGRNITGSVGAPLTNLNVASFTDLAGNVGVGTYSASIDWGDGSVSQGMIAIGPSNTFIVLGSHTYSTTSTFTVHIVIIPATGPAVTIAGTAMISPLASYTSGMPGRI